MKPNPTGKSYAIRVLKVHQIYDKYKKTGLSNREIWKRYIYPEIGISERSFYNYCKTDPNTILQLTQTN